MKPKVILFAGPAGCSKTPIAVYLSWKLGLPIFSNDAIRTEVTEDTLKFQPEDPEYTKRKDARLNELITSRQSFIYDASIDRSYEKVANSLKQNEYQYFIISFDQSKEQLLKMGRAKNYNRYDELLEIWYADHQKFLGKYRDEVDLVIDDNNFPKRLELSLKDTKRFLER